MGAIVDTLKIIGIFLICGILLVAFFWGLTILIPPGEDTHAGQNRVVWNEAIYSCPDCGWSGYPGSMSVIQEPVNRFGQFSNTFYCPECGVPMNIRDHGMVYVDSNNHYAGKATLS